MKKCPFCFEEIPEAAKVCKFCSSTVVRKCPHCAEEVSALARRCRFCQRDIPEDGTTSAPPPARAAAVAGGPVGEQRNIAILVILCIVTCGIWGIVAWYQVGSDLNRHKGRDVVNPGVDVLLSIVTCGLWTIYVGWNYGSRLKEITEEEGMPVIDVALACCLLAVAGCFIPFINVVAPAILQNELNNHWSRHGQAPSGAL